ncbi:hypothetical protein ABUE29_09225 [Mesorhizobium sp. ZMM04-4]
MPSDVREQAASVSIMLPAAIATPILRTPFIEMFQPWPGSPFRRLDGKLAAKRLTAVF